MQNAIRMADLSASDVGHVNAHATSTVVGDVGEAAAIRKAIGDHPVVTAPKSALGHLVGGAGAVERSEEHTSELQSREKLVCRLLLEKKNVRGYDQFCP